MDIRQSEATRYLCAAAYLDKGFRDAVFDQVIEQNHKGIGPSNGVDLINVAKHCISAKQMVQPRDTWFAILAIPFYLAAALIGVADGTSSPIPGWALSLLATAIAVAFSIDFFTTRRIKKTILRYFMKQNFRPEHVAIPRSHKLQQSLMALEAWQNPNVVTYSGFLPFVGSGRDIGGWSFALDLSKGKEELNVRERPQEISVTELYNRIDSAVSELNLKDIEIDDSLYVNGKNIRDDLRFLKDPLDRPLPRVEDEIVRCAMGKPFPTARHYKCIRVIGWSGDMILSLFVGITRVEHSLSVTVRYFLLTSVSARYRAIDSWNLTPTVRDLLKALGQSLFITPFALGFAPLYVLARFRARNERRRARKQLEKELREDPTFDYGASTTVRELASVWQYQHYFQKLDQEMYLKILEHQILDTIVEFLDSRDVDTSDIKERRTTILNNGVIMSGGSIQAQSVAVGRGAKGIVSSFAQMALPEKQAA